MPDLSYANIATSKWCIHEPADKTAFKELVIGFVMTAVTVRAGKKASATYTRMPPKYVSREEWMKSRY